MPKINQDFCLQDAIRQGKTFEKKRIIFQNLLRTARGRTQNFNNLYYCAEAAFLMNAWNDYNPGSTFKITATNMMCLSSVISTAANDYMEMNIGVMKEFFQFASEVRKISPMRFLSAEKYIGKEDGGPIKGFLQECCGLSGLGAMEEALRNEVLEVNQVALEKCLIERYGQNAFYDMFLQAIPKDFWFDRNNFNVSKYHFALMRLWPDAHRTFFVCGVERRDIALYAEKQDYVDAFSDVMRQIVMRSLSGEVQEMNSPHVKIAQKSRQFVLKFMMDSEQMSKAYLNIAAIDAKRLPDTGRAEMYKKALSQPDVTELKDV